MGKTLVVVESPAKAKTIKKYLGAGYEVVASRGHIKDLPKKLGVDVENDFTETYEVVPTKAKVVTELKAASKEAETVLLATDPDREGEAIAFHVADVIGDKKHQTKRVEFHEITRRGVEHGLANPRALDVHLYDAQRARRVLDRLVGYDVSALVWSKLAFGLSAGRVQSVALRLIVDKEEEIDRFVPEEYWPVSVVLRGSQRPDLMARLTLLDGKKLLVGNGAEADRVRRDLMAATYKVERITAREGRRQAPAPYTTSKLQQDAASYLHFSAKRTMQIAQGLYEGVDLKSDGGQVGLITYIRTDSVRVSQDAVAAVREYIEKVYGTSALPERPNEFKSKKLAQEAHEAIRPTSLDLSPEKVRKHLKDEQYKLYKLIWDRFVASQCTAAVYDQTSVEISARAEGRVYGLRASGRVLRTAGWLDVYGKGAEAPSGLAGEGEEETNGNGSSNGNGQALAGANAEEPVVEATDGALPELTEGEALTLVDPPGVVAEQKFTQPPARFNEGSLVRELEKRGIGRPSTYAEIISKVQARDYVERLAGGQFKPTPLGKLVVAGLVQSGLDFMDPGFTAKMEEELDAVEAGHEKRVALLKKFYSRFRKQLELAKQRARWTPEPEPTDLTCGDCGAPLLKRWSRNGWFLGCSRYPKCKFTMDIGGAQGQPVVRETDIACDKCGRKMVIRTGRFGEFLACSGYPECKNAKAVPLGIQCPKCGGDIIEVKPRKRGGRTFYGCSNYAADPPCDFKVWQRPVKEPCPSCGAQFLLRAGTKNQPMLVCANKACGFRKPYEEPPAEHAAEAAPASSPRASTDAAAEAPMEA
jgi:DNA topoisomerase-1